jgi:hypothetical protein
LKQTFKKEEISFGLFLIGGVEQNGGEGYLRRLC